MTGASTNKSMQTCKQGKSVMKPCSDLGNERTASVAIYLSNHNLTSILNCTLLCLNFLVFEAFGAWMGVVTTDIASVLVNTIFPKLTVLKVHIEFLAWLRVAVRGWSFSGW